MASLGFLGSLRLPYPDHGHGFWGQQTSTLNFCEEVRHYDILPGPLHSTNTVQDYALSYYCAEVCNVS